VTVVLAGIGGNHSNQLLPFLDFELIRSHPKLFQGYSDITVLHWALARHAGLSTNETEVLWDVVARRTEAAGLPVLANVEAGHADPMLTLPFGCPARLDADEKRLELLEAPTSEGD
jgi:muramoyltetrapeptide carboxypeptidase LdcA involved in peptidoglycan recycling